MWLPSSEGRKALIEDGITLYDDTFMERFPSYPTDATPTGSKVIQSGSPVTPVVTFGGAPGETKIGAQGTPEVMLEVVPKNQPRMEMVQKSTVAKKMFTWLISLNTQLMKPMVKRLRMILNSPANSADRREVLPEGQVKKIGKYDSAANEVVND